MILNSKPREEFQKCRFVQIFLLVVGPEALLQTIKKRSRLNLSSFRGCLPHSGTLKVTCGHLESRRVDPAGSDLPDRHLFPLVLPCFGASGPGFEAPCRQPEGHR